MSQALLQTDAATYQRLALLLTSAVEARLDALLAVDPGLRVTPHRWLCQPATANTPTAINQALVKLDFLHQLGLADWDTSGLNANRRKRLAHRARHRTSQAIGRYAPAKRYPLLVAFVLETYRDVLDAVLTMFSDYWAGAQRKAQREHEAHLLAIRQVRETALRVFAQVARTVVNEKIPAELVREAVFEAIPRERVEQALQTYYALSDTRLDSPLAFLLRRYTHLKQFSAGLLRQVSFTSAFAGDHFAEALALVVDCRPAPGASCQRMRRPTSLHPPGRALCTRSKRRNGCLMSYACWPPCVSDCARATCSCPAHANTSTWNAT